MKFLSLKHLALGFVFSLAVCSASQLDHPAQCSLYLGGIKGRIVYVGFVAADESNGLATQLKSVGHTIETCSSLACLSEALSETREIPDAIFLDSDSPDNLLETARIVNSLVRTSDLAPHQYPALIVRGDIKPSVKELLLTEHAAAVIHRDDSPAVCLASVQPVLRMKREISQMANLTLMDPLTGVFNRRGIESLAEREVALAARQNSAIAMIVIDLDNFKSINDRFSHSIGDAVLRQAAECLIKHHRSADFMGRFGGEEFVLIMPQTDLKTAKEVGERLRQALVDDLSLQLAGSTISVTGSFGVAVAHPKPGEKVEDVRKMLFSQADLAMYASKQNGRNRVTVFPFNHELNFNQVQIP